MMGWSEGEFTLQLWPSPPAEAGNPPVNLARVIHLGHKQHASPGRLSGFMSSRAGKYPARTSSFYDYQMYLELDPAEAVFLDRCTGKLRLDELLPSDPAEAVQGADVVQINNGVGTVTSRGQKSVTVSATTTFTLTANAGDSTMTATTLVQVAGGVSPSPGASPSPSPSPTRPPAPSRRTARSSTVR